MEYTWETYPPEPNTSYPSPFFLSSSHLLTLCPSAATVFLLPFLYAVIFLTGLPGNALSLWVFLRRIATKNSTHVYLSNLGLSNLLFALTAPLMAAYYSQGSSWPPRGLLCLFVVHGVTPVMHVNIYVSVLVLTWLALSRFATLIQRTHASRPSACATLLPHGFFTRLRRVSFARRLCAGVWGLVVGAVVPVSVYYSVKEVFQDRGTGETGEGWGEDGGEKGRVCYSVGVELGGGLTRAVTAVGVAIFYVCFLLVLMSYVTVARHIRRSQRSTAITDSQRMLARVFRNIVVIQVVLIVCLLPYHIYRTIIISLLQHQPDLANPSHTTQGPTHTAPNHHCHPLSSRVEVKNFLLCLAVFRSATDPVMYFLLDKSFHKHILSLFRLCQQKPSSQINSSENHQTQTI